MDITYEYKMGQNLRRLRESRGMTQEQAAARFQTQGCDLTRSALAKIEVGQRHIYPDEIHLFAQIYETGYDSIFP